MATDTTKKRKKNKSTTTTTTTTSSSSSSSSSISLRIKCVPETANQKGRPVLAYFPKGQPRRSKRPRSSSTDSHPDDLPDSLFESARCFRKDSANAKKQKQRRVHLETERMLFQGSNFGTHAAQKNMHTYLVGVFDRASKSLELVPVEHIYKMKGSVKGLDTDVEDAALKDMSARDVQRLLISSFGGKKSKQAVASQITNSVNKDNMGGRMAVSQALAVKATQEPASQEVLSTQINQRLLPPYNKDATDPIDAYPIDGIMSEDERAALDIQEILDLFDDEGQPYPDISTDAYPQFVLDQLPRMANMTDERRGKEFARRLLYLALLYRLHHARDSVLNRRQELLETLGCDNTVAGHLLARFCSRSGNRLHRDKRLKGKLILHAFVLSLHLKAFDFDPSALVRDFQLGDDQARVYFNELGCRYSVKRKDGERQCRARLVLPLSFPEPNRRRGGR